MARSPHGLACATAPATGGAPARTYPGHRPTAWSPLHELLDAQVERSPDEAVVRVAGELDIASAPKLAQLLLGDCRGAERVVLELGPVRFIDAHSVRMLLDVRETLASFGSRLTVREVSCQVHKVLSICGVLDVLTTPDS